MGARKKVRIGVIGAGTWSQYAHLPAIKAHPDAELFAVCQRTESKLRATAAKWDVPHAFTDYREMIASGALDGIIVSTPHDFHYEPVKHALEHGLHVLVEKPMVIETAQASELVALARTKGRLLLVGHPLPCTAQACRAREVILGGAFGEVRFVSAVFATSSAYIWSNKPMPAEMADCFEEQANCPYNPETYNHPDTGGMGHTMASHTANLLFFLTGRHAVEVFAMMSSVGHKADAYDSICFKLDNGALGTLASWGTVSYKHKGLNEIRVHGDHGLVILNIFQGKGVVRWADGREEPLPDIPEDERWPQLLPPRNFVDVITGKAESICPGELGLYTVQFIEAVYESAASGQPVEIEQT